MVSNGSNGISSLIPLNASYSGSNTNISSNTAYLYSSFNPISWLWYTLPTFNIYGNLCTHVSSPYKSDISGILNSSLYSITLESSSLAFNSPLGIISHEWLILTNWHLKKCFSNPLNLGYPSILLFRWPVSIRFSCLDCWSC